MSRTGRQTKLTPSLATMITQAVRQGVPLVSAARLAGVSKATVLAWLQRGDGTHPTRPPRQPFVDFADAIARARAQDEAQRIARINQAGQGGAVVYRKTTDSINAQGEVVKRVTEERYSEPPWQADAFHLERAYPDRWGRKDRLDLHLTMQRVAAKVAAELGMRPEDVLAEAQALLLEVDRGQP